MTDSELPGDPDSPADDTGDLPPPSTWAGKSRKAEEESAEPESRSMTDEFEGLADELSADLDDLDADEQEEPPDEFAFDDEDDDAGDDLEAGSDPETEAKSADEPVKGSDPTVADPSAPAVAAVSSVTVEADTLALSDVEAAREAAHAGLSSRAKKSSFSHEVTTGAHKVAVQPKKASAPPPDSDDEDPEGVGEPPKRRIGLRFVAAAFVIVSSMAAATAVSFLLFLSDIAEGLNDDGTLGAARAQLEDVEGGAPQTILILGSDKREGTPGDPGRSDTAILLRVDPDKKFLSLMSLPRDLNVPIPGYGTDKLNAAYSFGEQDNPGGGGTELAIETIKGYLDIPINHVVNVDFEGFYEAVNAIGCVYIDVDRHYFNSNEGVFEGSEDFYAEIDVESGYQKLCGYRALQYVRYRHEDNDLVRGARQQDFIREARQRIRERLERFVGREIERAEGARKDESQRTGYARVGGGIEAGQQRVEQMGRTRDGTAVRGNRAFHQDCSLSAQPNHMGRRHPGQVATRRPQENVAHDSHRFDVVDGDPHGGEVCQ